MGTGYTRNDTANNIADGNIINASDLDGEFDAVQSAFNASTGHTHDGTTGEGAPIEVIGPTQDVVATASVLRPKTDNTVDLGTTTLEYKDLFLDGTAHIDTLDVDENASITGTLGVTGAATLSSTLGVTGATTLSSTLGVTGATTLSSTLGVTGAATLSSTLAVTGATGIDGDFDINTNKFTVASATGNTVVAGTLGVTGATTATGGLNVDTISEITSANGVVIDGVTLKDGGATVTADITFGDNDKVIFGAGSDLQIYHDGSNNSSYIKETGAGSFNIEATNLFLKREGGTENFIDCVTNGAVTAYYDGSPKLATTSTGVDITGTLTSDGLEIDGKVLINAPADTLAQEIRGRSSDDVGYLQFSNNAGTTSSYIGSNGSYLNFEVGSAERMRIANNGDISFYEDTGTTAKFFWDASAESLGLGTTSPLVPLQVNMTDANFGVANLSTGVVQLGSTSTADDIAFGTIGAGPTFTEYMRIDNGTGNVGVGTTSPSKQFHQIRTGSASDLPTLATETGFITQSTNVAASSQNISIIAGASGESRLFFGDTGDEDVGHIIYNHASNYMLFSTAASEAMRIDSSGNLLVGHTSISDWTSTVGAQVRGTGYVIGTVDGDYSFIANRLNSDGDLMQFRKDGTTVGSIGSRSSGANLYIAFRTETTGDGCGLTGSSASDGAIIPSDGNGAAIDNHIDLGATGTRFDDIYATNGTIQTSDRNEKQDIAELSDAEQRVAVAAKGLLRKFRWKDAVAEKGDEARTHFGIIAQDLQAAFAAEGLDAGDYAMFISSTWTDEETGEERTRMGVRYSELLAFIIAAI